MSHTSLIDARVWQLLLTDPGEQRSGQLRSSPYRFKRYFTMYGTSSSSRTTPQTSSSRTA
jgi:hypothetical protein